MERHVLSCIPCLDHKNCAYMHECATHNNKYTLKSTPLATYNKAILLFWTYPMARRTICSPSETSNEIISIKKCFNRLLSPQILSPLPAKYHLPYPYGYILNLKIVQLIAMIYLYITLHCICLCCNSNRLPHVSNFNAPINVMPYSPPQAYMGIALLCLACQGTCRRSMANSCKLFLFIKSQIFTCGLYVCMYVCMYVNLYMQIFTLEVNSFCCIVWNVCGTQVSQKASN